MRFIIKKINFCIVTVILVSGILYQPLTLHASIPENIQVCSQKDLLQDLEIFVTTLQELHGNLFYSINQQHYHELYVQAKNKIIKRDSMSVYSFYRTLIPIVTAVKCGHTNIFMENDNDYKVVKTFQLGICDSKVYITKNDFGLPDHVEIVSVNQYPVIKIIQDILKIIPADGDNIQYKTHKIEDRFLYYYNILFNYKDKTYKIKYIDQKGNNKIAIITEQTTKTEVNKNQRRPFQFTTNDKGTALLKFSTFYTPDFKNQGYSPKKTTKKLFQQIQKESIDTLIIDLRDNEGGSVVFTSYIFSFLTEKKYQFYRTMALSPISKFTYQEYIFKDPFVRFKKLLTKKLNDKRIYDHKLTHASKPSKKYNFTGSLLVVANGSTFSAASIFASLLKSESEALILGEKTGSSYNKNGIYQVGFNLPNSKLKVVCPFTFVRLNVKEAVGSDTGVWPDIEISSCVLDNLNDIESFLRFVR